MGETIKISSLIKKILIVFALFFSLICVLVGLYNFVLLRSPYYSAYMVYESFRKNDVMQFDKYCDIEAVYSDAYDQIRAETLDPDSPAGRLAVGLKDFTVKKLAGQLRHQIAERKKKDEHRIDNNIRQKIAVGEYKFSPKKKAVNFSAFDVLEFGKLPTETDQMFFERHVNFKYLRFKDAGVIEKEDGAVIVACLFHDAQLNENLTIKVRMIPMDGGRYWRAVAVTNAMEIVLKRDMLAMQKLEKINEDVNLEMGKYVQIVDTHISLIKGKSIFAGDKFHYQVNYTLLDDSKRINQIEGIFIINDSKGRTALREYHYIDDVGLKYEQKDSIHEKEFVHEWEKDDHIGRLLTRENGVLQKDGNNCTSDFIVKGLYFTDGSYLQATLDLPSPK